MFRCTSPFQFHAGSHSAKPAYRVTGTNQPTISKLHTLLCMYGFARLLTVTRVISIHSPRSDPIRVNSRQSAKTLGNCIQIYARRWRVFIYAYRVNISKAKRIWKWEDTSPLRSNRKEPREPLTVSSQNSGKKNPKEPCSHMHR